jgi:dinuclear metal center YbgI/SA1388 family protein
MSISKEVLMDSLEAVAPRALALAWDNHGFQLDVSTKEINRLLIALEVTEEVIREAMACKADIIVCHHPLFFKPINNIDNKNIIGNLIVRLIENRISVYTSHTAFDVVSGGNSAYLADLIGLENIRQLKGTNSEDVLADMVWAGSFSESKTLKEIVEIIKSSLSINIAVHAVGDPAMSIREVGVCTGAGSDCMASVIDHKLDLFITGDIRYHDAQFARASGLALIDAGHYFTEQIFIKNMASQLNQKIGKQVEIIESQVDLNPFIML